MWDVDVPKDAPPMFNVIATDDFLFRGQFGIIKSWYEAGVTVEFHLYQNGGLGFGLGNPDRTSNRWFDAFIHWLEVNGFLAANSGEKIKLNCYNKRFLPRSPLDKVDLAAVYPFKIG